MNHHQQHPQHYQHAQQQLDYPIPPPPPSPHPGGTNLASSVHAGAAALYPHLHHQQHQQQHYLLHQQHQHQHQQQQQQQQQEQRARPVSALLPSITTAFLGHSPQTSTPISAHPNSAPGGALHPYTPATPSALNPRSPRSNPSSTPVMEPYNPRQWGRGQVSGSQMVFQQQRQSNVPPSTSHVTGMEAAMPSPPPPYSPRTPDDARRSSVASPMLESIGFTASPLAERTESSTRASPQVPMSPAFPPPPPQSSRQRERSASGIGGNRSFFSLSGLRGKQPAHIDPQQPTSSNPANGALFAEPRAPASRRAASTGHIQANTPPVSSSSTPANAESSWQPGMPLPGPPPGPPPPGARSQSLNRPVGSSGSGRTTPEAGLEAPRPRRAAATPSLGTVPPTPANWVDGPMESIDAEQPPMPQSSDPAEPNYHPLTIDTGSNREPSLTRRHAQRDTSAQGIRERRSKSRAGNITNNDHSGPSNLVFSPVGGSISRRREHTRTTSGYAGPSSAPGSAREQPNSASKLSGSVLTPPYTPAVGNQTIKVPGSASSDRPISHILHVPNEDAASMPAPLTPARPPTSASSFTKPSPRLDGFALQAIERHRSFVEKEVLASSDEERLELFTNFIVHESRLRRDRYTTAYNAMAGEILDLTRDMWRSYNAKNNRRAATPSTSMSSIDPTVPSWGSDGQPTSAHGNNPSSASSMGDYTPATESGSVGDYSDSFDRSDARQWPDSFKPSLSPIPSMAVSTVPDEGSSRGRTASRGWESNYGGGSIGRPDRIEKSRRETKYMGVNPAALQDTSGDAATPGSSALQYAYGPDEYPPEKVGWHESGEYETPMATPHQVDNRKATTPGIAPLDVSRLVTLPPPYPRHHPAVNNSHPRLAELRSEHRALADNSDIQKIKESFIDKEDVGSHEQQEDVTRRRAQLRMDIQGKVANGSMSFADAAKAEAQFDADEADKGKAAARAHFDAYEASISLPLNKLLTERLDKANACIGRLREELESVQRSANPNQTQEEGDEHPERLEKLTLLKWLFETREQLHKEMFELHTVRSQKYSEVILTPFRISKAQTKLEDATAFFKKDNTERQVSHSKDSLKRLEELQTVMEKNVSLGVENQLSAFWDIAPGLLEVIQQVPFRMDGFEVQIPLNEFEENPSYHEHPLQYLYSLLNHAQKSAYQFIESQINLLCLLHEVRTATSKSRLRLLELERWAASPGHAEIHAEMVQAKREAEDQLTVDLKEKVGEVERQWQEALGDEMEGCRERVSVWLEENGGLEDFLEV